MMDSSKTGYAENSWSTTPWKAKLRQPASTQLEPARNQLLEHKIGIIPPLHRLQPLHVRGAVMCNDILVITRIVHELVRQIIPVAPRNVLNLRVDRSRRIMCSVVAVGEPVARIEHEPGLVDGLQAQGIAPTSETRVDEAGGVRLKTQSHGAGGHRRYGLQFRGRCHDFFDLRVERGVRFEARGEPVPSAKNVSSSPYFFGGVLRTEVFLGQSGHSSSG